MSKTNKSTATAAGGGGGGGGSGESKASEHRQAVHDARATTVAKHYVPVHVKLEPSILTTSELEHVNMFGIVNLCALLLFLHNFRLVIENLRKHGWLFGAFFLSSRSNLSATDWALLVGIVGLLVPIVVVWQNDVLRSRKLIGVAAHRFVALTVISSTLLVPVAAILGAKNPFPYTAFALLMNSTIVTMKLFSYYLVNSDLNLLKTKGEIIVETIEGVDKPIEYPENLTFGNIMYFMAAPTLCYQLNYPRTPSIRWLWVGRRVVQMIVLILFALFMIEQYIAPTIRDSTNAIIQLDWFHLVERVLKLSVPNLYVWLVFFLVFFHLWFNITAELLRFGDRRFYGDWWNACSLGYYWRNWNLPVHMFMVRHIYVPLRAKKFSKFGASFVVFFVSAVAHEMLISVPCQILIPLILFSEKFSQGSVVGNLNFWFSFCIFGQPVSVLLYYYSYAQWHSTTPMNVI